MLSILALKWELLRQVVSVENKHTVAHQSPEHKTPIYISPALWSVVELQLSAQAKTSKDQSRRNHKHFPTDKQTEFSNYQLITQLQTQNPACKHICAPAQNPGGFFFTSSKIKQHFDLLIYQFDAGVCQGQSTTTREDPRHSWNVTNSPSAQMKTV